MALKLFERYAGRANPASIDYPQGSFKNKSAPNATDGTLLEQDWANDNQGFLQSILKYRGVSANGQVDKVGDSQYFNALFSDPSETLRGLPMVATQNEVDSADNDAKFITPKKLRFGFIYSFGSNGYIIFPTWAKSWCVQWGVTPDVAKGSVGTFPLPIAFPNSAWRTVACQNGTLIPESIGVSIAQSTISVSVSNTGTQPSPRGVAYIAVGR